MGKKLTKADIDNCRCGMDILDDFGWFSTVFKDLGIAMVFGSASDITETFDRIMKEWVDKNTTASTKILNEKEEYEFEYILMCELEIATNWLLSKAYRQKDSNVTKAFEKCYYEIYKINETACGKDKDFAHLHFRMTG